MKKTTITLRNGKKIELLDGPCGGGYYHIGGGYAFKKEELGKKITYFWPMELIECIEEEIICK